MDHTRPRFVSKVRVPRKVVQNNSKMRKTINQKLSGLRVLGLDINLKEVKIKEELQVMTLKN